jgi:mannose-6-phosphate isomerase-like protein (cupin superfamily)
MILSVAVLGTVVGGGAMMQAQAPAGAQGAAVYPPPAAKITAGDAPAYAFDITKAEIDYVIKNAPASPPDRQLRVIDMGKYNLGIGIIRRGPTNEKPGDPVPVLWHDYTPEIYYITSGSGILTTGGVILNQRPGAGVPNVMNGPSGSGIAGPGSYSRRVSAGDIIVIPNKVAHGWSGVTDHIEYLSYRPDPDRVLPAGYVYPLLLRTTPTQVPTPGVGRGAAPAAAPAAR